MGRPIPFLKLRLPMGDLDAHLMHGPLCPPESSTHTASQSVEPFLQGKHTDRQTDQPTDHASRSVTIGRIYVGSTAMRPENYYFFLSV